VGLSLRVSATSLGDCVIVSYFAAYLFGWWLMASAVVLVCFGRKVLLPVGLQNELAARAVAHVKCTSSVAFQIDGVALACPCGTN
jgi:hypothetical protein